MLEDQIKTLIETIQANTAALVATRGSASVDKPATDKKRAASVAEVVPITETPKHTIADIRDAAQKVLEAGGIAHIKPLLGKYGVSKISAAPEARYGEVLADLKEALDKSTSSASVV